MQSPIGVPFLIMIKNNDTIYKLLNDPNYSIDSFGKAYTRVARTGKVMLSGEWREISNKDKKGYSYINYSRKKLYIHRIVYAKYIGELNEELVINHKNGIKHDNRVENLELVTVKENNIHRFRVLKSKPVIGNAKIDKQIADEIRREHEKGKPYSFLVKKYGICKGSISAIVNNKIWK